MNYSIIKRILGKIMILIALFMVFPLIVCICYQEELINYLSFLGPMLILLVVGYLLNFKKPTNTKMLAREGIVIVGLAWFVMALFGCLPFVISKEIPNFFDAFFEMSSGFTTTGASVVTDVTKLSHSMLFWRSFSHWIGGMGVLVFILAIIPESKDGSSMHILRAESPGPQVGKLVSKMQVTSRILYLIYLVMTIVLILLLWLGPDEKMSLFNSIVYSLGTAGTGGFSIDSDGLASYSAYSQYVIAIFMLVFGVNFSLFYLILIGKVKEALKNEELKWYMCIVVISVVIIFGSLYVSYKELGKVFNAEEAFRHSLFQVAAIISTTGYATIDFIQWPQIAIGVLAILMFFGGCAGSTAGGMKISRINILFKSSIKKIKNITNSRKVETVCIDKKPINESTIEGVQSFFIVYMFVFILCTLIISIDGFDMVTNITTSLTCISNVGPGLSSIVGPMGNFSGFSSFSKFVLSIEMIAGRLELFPILIMFSPKIWKSKV